MVLDDLSKTLYLTWLHCFYCPLCTCYIGVILKASIAHLGLYALGGQSEAL